MRLLRLFLMFLLILNLSGCATTSTQTESLGIQDLEPSAMLRFGDVPVPVGFRIMPEKSFVLESGGVRAGILRYAGKAEADSIVNFYKNQMPIYNWKLLNVLEYGNRLLNFEGNNESCVITIDIKAKKAEITISLAPKSPLAPQEKKERSGKTTSEKKSLDK